MDDGEDDELEVRYTDGRWMMKRGDFHAQWNPASNLGCVRQAAYPYAIDAVMRIVHSLVLAKSVGIPCALGERDSQRAGISILGSIGRGARDDFAPGGRLT